MKERSSRAVVTRFGYCVRHVDNTFSHPVFVRGDGGVLVVTDGCHAPRCTHMRTQLSLCVGLQQQGQQQRRTRCNNKKGRTGLSFALSCCCCHPLLPSQTGRSRCRRKKKRRRRRRRGWEGKSAQPQDRDRWRWRKNLRLCAQKGFLRQRRPCASTAATTTKKTP